jgi:aminomethyltransferase
MRAFQARRLASKSAKCFGPVVSGMMTESQQLSPALMAVPSTAGFDNSGFAPDKLISFGTRVRKSPFFQAQKKNKVAEFSVYNKTLLPISWGTQTGVEEYENLCKNVCLWDVSCQRQVALSGPDASKLAQLLSTRNLTKFRPGEAKYVICTDSKGTVINDPLVLKLADDSYWFSIADRDFELWAQAHACSRNFDVDVSELEVPVMAVQGPRSRDLLLEVFGWDVVGDLKFFNFRKVEWHGVPTLVARAGWSPELGYEIYPIPGGEGREKLDARIGSAMWEELVDKGAAHGLGFGTPNQPRRLEGGMLSSCDYEVTRLNALELGLPSHLVNLDMAPNFVGKDGLKGLRQAALDRASSSTSQAAAANPGADRLVVGIQVDTDLPLSVGMHDAWDVQARLPNDSTATASDPIVGKVSSIAKSPKVGAHIGLATLEAGLCDAGTRITVLTPEGPRGATVVALPFPETSSPDHRSTFTPL